MVLAGDLLSQPDSGERVSEAPAGLASLPGIGRCKDYFVPK